MNPDDKRSAAMAAVLFAAFAALAYFLPTIMLAVGDVSIVAAVGVAAAFLVLPFVVFWLRGRAKR
ncbi:MAG: hypothetical protein IPL47_10085 [Phyllobacteriaceae bacterium]|nr:hypothetical protein [Phyllobacteriaceae bacterium]